MIYLLTLLLSFFSYSQVWISEKIYIPEKDYDHQFSKDGTLIQPLNYLAVNKIKKHILEKYQHKLEDRKEAHITIITPPEGRTRFANMGRIGLDLTYPTEEMIDDYSKEVLTLPFKVHCLARQVSKKNGNIVYFLVVRTPAQSIRSKIYKKAVNRPKGHLISSPLKYYPHITIGYIGGDAHGVSKSDSECIDSDIKYY